MFAPGLPFFATLLAAIPAATGRSHIARLASILWAT